MGCRWTSALPCCTRCAGHHSHAMPCCAVLCCAASCYLCCLPGLLASRVPNKGRPWLHIAINPACPFRSCPAPPAADPHCKGVCRAGIPPSAVAAAPHLFLRRFPVQPLPHRHCGPVPGCPRLRASGVLRGVLRSLISAFLLPAAMPSHGVSPGPRLFDSSACIRSAQEQCGNSACAWLPACALHTSPFACSAPTLLAASGAAAAGGASAR